MQSAIDRIITSFPHGEQPQDLDREGFLELIGGRVYADPQRQAELFWDGLPLEYDLDALPANLRDQPTVRYLRALVAFQRNDLGQTAEHLRRGRGAAR